MCGAAGRKVLMGMDGSAEILAISRGNFAPEAVILVNKEVARFLQPKRTDGTMDSYVLEFDGRRHRAESEVQVGGDFPECSVHAEQGAFELREIVGPC